MKYGMNVHYRFHNYLAFTIYDKLDYGFDKNLKSIDHPKTGDIIARLTFLKKYDRDMIRLAYIGAIYNYYDAGLINYEDYL